MAKPSSQSPSQSRGFAWEESVRSDCHTLSPSFPSLGQYGLNRAPGRSVLLPTRRAGCRSLWSWCWSGTWSGSGPLPSSPTSLTDCRRHTPLPAMDTVRGPRESLSSTEDAGDLSLPTGDVGARGTRQVLFLVPGGWQGLLL